jgi:hypothetical protein
MQEFPETLKLLQGFLQGEKVEKGCSRCMKVISDHDPISFRFNTTDTKTFSEKCGISLGFTLFVSLTKRKIDGLLSGLQRTNSINDYCRLSFINIPH